MQSIRASSGSAIATAALADALFDSPALLRMADDAVIDEAVFSSMIEGAFTSREAAANFLRRDRKPKDKSEQMVKNNYDALTYALEHLDEEITEDTIVEIARIVTRSAAEEAGRDTGKSRYMSWAGRTWFIARRRRRGVEMMRACWGGCPFAKASCIRFPRQSARRTLSGLCASLHGWQRTHGVCAQPYDADTIAMRFSATSQSPTRG